MSPDAVADRQFHAQPPEVDPDLGFATSDKLVEIPPASSPTSHYNLAERLREVNDAFNADRTPVERVRPLRIHFNEEVSVFCPSLEGGDDADSTSSAPTTTATAARENGGGGSSSSESVDDLIIRDLETELFPPHGELGEGEYSHAQRNGTASADRHDTGGGLYASDLDFSSLGSNASDCGSESDGRGVDAVGALNGPTSNRDQQSSTDPAATSDGVIPNGILKHVGGKIVIDLTLNPADPPAPETTSNPFFSKPVEARQLQDKLTELCGKTEGPDGPGVSSSRVVVDGSDDGVNNNNNNDDDDKESSVVKLGGINSTDSTTNGPKELENGTRPRDVGSQHGSVDDDEQLAVLTSRPIIAEIMEKVAAEEAAMLMLERQGGGPGPGPSDEDVASAAAVVRITRDDGGRNNNNNSNGSDEMDGSMNDSSDSLVIPTDTGSDTSSEITAVLQADFGERVGGGGGSTSFEGSVENRDEDDDGGDGRDGTSNSKPSLTQKRQRPASAKVRAKPNNSVSNMAAVSSSTSGTLDEVDENHDDEETSKTVKFTPEPDGKLGEEGGRGQRNSFSPLKKRISSPGLRRKSDGSKRTPPSSSITTADNKTEEGNDALVAEDGGDLETKRSSSSSKNGENNNNNNNNNHRLPALRRPKSAATLSRQNGAGVHRSKHSEGGRGGRDVVAGGGGGRGPGARPVTAESIQHLRYDDNHPGMTASSSDSSGGGAGGPLSPKRSRQPLTWQYAKLPTYDGAKSPYGLSSKQLEERERWKRELLEKRQREKEEKIQAELEKRRQREINFQLWLQRKKEERSSGDSSSTGSSAAGGGGKLHLRPGSVSPVKSRRLPLRAKDPAAAEESFKAWMERKKEEEKMERRRAELRKLASSPAKAYTKEDCDEAFHEWVKRKNAERRAEEASRGHMYRSMSLDRLLKHARTLKSAYMAYFGPDF